MRENSIRDSTNEEWGKHFRMICPIANTDKETVCCFAKSKPIQTPLCHTTKISPNKAGIKILPSLNEPSVYG